MRAPTEAGRWPWRRLLLVLGIVHLVGLASSLDAMMSSRTSQGAVAWIVSLNTMPYVAVPAYWVFGRARFQGYVSARRDEDSALGRALAELSWSPVVPSHHGTPVLILPTGLADRFETASLMIQQAIHAAHERVWISSPYFAAYAFLDSLLEAGVEVYRYEGGFLHGKAFLVDDIGAAVGTMNLDNRSFRLNFEVTALVMDPSFADEVESMFEADFARSRQMQPAEIEAQPLWHRVAARAAYLLAPVL